MTVAVGTWTTAREAKALIVLSEDSKIAEQFEAGSVEADASSPAVTMFSVEDNGWTTAISRPVPRLGLVLGLVKDADNEVGEGIPAAVAPVTATTVDEVLVGMSSGGSECKIMVDAAWVAKSPPLILVPGCALDAAAIVPEDRGEVLEVLKVLEVDSWVVRCSCPDSLARSR